MENKIKDRVLTRLAELGLKPSSFELRAALEAEGFNGTYLYELASGKKNSIPKTKFARLARVLRVPPSYFDGAGVLSGANAAASVSIVGICEAGAWRKAEPSALPGPVITPDSRVAADKQIAYLVRGNHAENIGIGDGSVIVVGTGMSPRNGEVVVVESHREDGMIETLVRKFSDADQSSQPNGKQTVVGIVLQAIKTF